VIYQLDKGRKIRVFSIYCSPFNINCRYNVSGYGIPASDTVIAPRPSTWCDTGPRLGVPASSRLVLVRPSAPAPKIGIFWVLKEDCFRRTFSQCTIGRFSWISWIDRWHTDSQQCSEPQPQTAPAKATGGRQEYYQLPRLRSAVTYYAASACISGVNCVSATFNTLLKIYLFWGPVRPVWCFVTPSWWQLL